MSELGPVTRYGACITGLTFSSKAKGLKELESKELTVNQTVDGEA